MKTYAFLIFFTGSVLTANAMSLENFEEDGHHTLQAEAPPAYESYLGVISGSRFCKLQTEAPPYESLSPEDEPRVCWRVFLPEDLEDPKYGGVLIRELLSEENFRKFNKTWTKNSSSLRNRFFQFFRRTGYDRLEEETSLGEIFNESVPSEIKEDLKRRVQNTLKQRLIHVAFSGKIGPKGVRASALGKMPEKYEDINLLFIKTPESLGKKTADALEESGALCMSPDVISVVGKQKYFYLILCIPDKKLVVFRDILQELEKVTNLESAFWREDTEKALTIHDFIIDFSYKNYILNKHVYILPRKKAWRAGTVAGPYLIKN